VSFEEGSVKLDLAADLTKHEKSVNCVRWSPNGEILASSDDASAIITWTKKNSAEANIFERDDIAEGDKEVWVVFKVLRAHMEDVYDLSWSFDSMFLVSGSVDNKAIIWDVQKQKNLGMLEHKGFVQGVAYDPIGNYIITLSTDRHICVFDVKTKKNLQRVNKAILPMPKTHEMFGKTIRLFHDDTLQTFFRRLSFSPDGNLIVAPSGICELEGEGSKAINTTYIFTRTSLKQ
jgi:chromatin assembly factor 1 subunit B